MVRKNAGLTTIDANNIYQKDVIGNVRTAQEDSHDIAALTPNGDVFVVCDGMGGHVGGKQASSIAVKSILEYLKKERYESPFQALDGALQFANMQILGYAEAHPELKGMGTTACIVLLGETEAYIAHVGDSRIYLYLGEEKQLHRLTKDHSYVQALVDAGQITEEEAEHHPNKNRILKALGVTPKLIPSYDKVLPKNGDVFLICSDGLSGMLSDKTMENVLSDDISIAEKGDKLISLALEAGGLDNITLELVRISSSPNRKSVFQGYTHIEKRKQVTRHTGEKYILRLILSIVFACIIGCVVWLMVSDMLKERKSGQLEESITKVTHKIDSVEMILEDLKIQYKECQDNTNKAREILEKNKEDSIVITKSIRNYEILENGKLNEIYRAESEVDSLNKLKDSLLYRSNRTNNVKTDKIE